jgi:hypothetical protein
MPWQAGHRKVVVCADAGLIDWQLEPPYRCVIALDQVGSEMPDYDVT